MTTPIQFTFRQPWITSLVVAAILAAATCPATETLPAVVKENVAPAAGAAARTLDLEAAQKQQVMHSMIGFTPTRIFYKIPGQAAVVTVSFTSKGPDSGASVTVNLFAIDTSEEDIGKWINNQHSDALFIDPAEPILTETLPEGTAVVGEMNRVGKESNPGPHGGEYFKNDLGFSIKEFKHPEGKFILKRFKDNATVYEKVAK